MKKIKNKQVNPEILKDIDTDKINNEMIGMVENIAKINSNQLILEEKIKTIQENQKQQEAYFMAICDKLEITDGEVDAYIE